MNSQQEQMVVPQPSNVKPIQALSSQQFRQKQYIKVSKATRKEILSKLINDGMSLTQVSDIFKVNPSTCRVILNTYKDFGRIGKKQTRKTKFRISTKVNFSILNPLTSQPFEVLPLTSDTEVLVKDLSKMFVEKKEWASQCNGQLSTILKNTLQESLNTIIKVIHQAALKNCSPVGLDLLKATSRACQTIQVQLDRDHKKLLLMKQITNSPNPNLVVSKVLLQQAVQQANFRQMYQQAQQNNMLQIHQLQFNLLQNQLFGMKPNGIKQEEINDKVMKQEEGI